MSASIAGETVCTDATYKSNDTATATVGTVDTDMIRENFPPTHSQPSCLDLVWAFLVDDNFGQDSFPDAHQRRTYRNGNNSVRDLHSIRKSPEPTVVTTKKLREIKSEERKTTAKKYKKHGKGNTRPHRPQEWTEEIESEIDTLQSIGVSTSSSSSSSLKPVEYQDDKIITSRQQRKIQRGSERSNPRREIPQSDIVEESSDESNSIAYYDPIISCPAKKSRSTNQFNHRTSRLPKSNRNSPETNHRQKRRDPAHPRAKEKKGILQRIYKTTKGKRQKSPNLNPRRERSNDRNLNKSTALPPRHGLRRKRSNAIPNISISNNDSPTNSISEDCEANTSTMMIVESKLQETDTAKEKINVDPIAIAKAEEKPTSIVEKIAYPEIQRYGRTHFQIPTHKRANSFDGVDFRQHAMIGLPRSHQSFVNEDQQGEKCDRDDCMKQISPSEMEEVKLHEKIDRVLLASRDEYNAGRQSDLKSESQAEVRETIHKPLVHQPDASPPFIFEGIDHVDNLKESPAGPEDSSVPAKQQQDADDCSRNSHISTALSEHAVKSPSRKVAKNKPIRGAPKSYEGPYVIKQMGSDIQSLPPHRVGAGATARTCSIDETRSEYTKERKTAGRKITSKIPLRQGQRYFTVDDNHSVMSSSAQTVGRKNITKKKPRYVGSASSVGSMPF